MADGGTIFLDEVGEIAPSRQVKLLRAIDGYGYLPVGGNRVKNSNFRVIAATNRNLEEMVRNGTMRQDFYYRIKAFHLTMPSLRERREDIPMLANFFLRRIPGAKEQVLSLDVQERLCGHAWPGNVRELQNAVYRYAAFQELELEEHGPEAADIFQGHRQLGQAEGPWAKDKASLRPQEALAPSPRPGDRELILGALERNLWNVSRAARQLGWCRATIYRRMGRLGLSRSVEGQGDDEAGRPGAL
jgi:transcriptional regulator with GAF, ATPase, and Fis domain